MRSHSLKKNQKWKRMKKKLEDEKRKNEESLRRDHRALQKSFLMPGCVVALSKGEEKEKRVGEKKRRKKFVTYPFKQVMNQNRWWW